MSSSSELLSRTDLSTLERQILFSLLVPKLLDRARELGYEVTISEAWRSDEQAAINALGVDGWRSLTLLLEGHPQFHALSLALATKIANRSGVGILLSVHRERLAIDINLFKWSEVELKYVWVTDGAAFKPLGEYWKSLHPLCRWGGDFRDSDHFSIEDLYGRK